MKSKARIRAFRDTSFLRFEQVPNSIVNDVIGSIRKRKGLPPELPKLADFLD